MTVWVVVGVVSALVFLQLQCSGAENCPITIGAYGEGCAPIDNDGQGIWYQDFGGAPDSPTHVYHGWGSPPCRRAAVRCRPARQPHPC